MSCVVGCAGWCKLAVGRIKGDFTGEGGRQAGRGRHVPNWSYGGFGGVLEPERCREVSGVRASGLSGCTSVGWLSVVAYLYLLCWHIYLSVVAVAEAINSFYVLVLVTSRPSVIVYLLYFFRLPSGRLATCFN